MSSTVVTMRRNYCFKWELRRRLTFLNKSDEIFIKLVLIKFIFLLVWANVTGVSIDRLSTSPGPPATTIQDESILSSSSSPFKVTRSVETTILHDGTKTKLPEPPTSVKSNTNNSNRKGKLGKNPSVTQIKGSGSDSVRATENKVELNLNFNSANQSGLSMGQVNNSSNSNARGRRVKSQNGEQEEKLLLRKILQGYDKEVRPVRLAKNPVLIQVGITLTQIFDMDEKNQVLTTNVWLDQEWTDELLQWEPTEYNGLDSIRIPCKLLWLPDVVLYNSADDYTRGYMPSRAMVSHDGKVFWPPPTKFRSTCPVDVTYFPFDDQICKLKLGSWTYNGYQVDITNRTSEVDLSNYVENGEWELLEAQLERNVVFYSCCPEPFPDVTITLIIRRKTLYYIYNIVLPCMMLSVLTLLVFCLPPDSGEKVALGITVLLAFSVFMLAIAEKMPETSESIPLIGIYLTAVMAITSISVIVTVIVLNLHYLGPRVQKIPSWLRCFLPKDDIDFLREKSLLLFQNCSIKTGNRRIQPHYLISHQSLYQHAPASFSTSVPPPPTKYISTSKSAPQAMGSTSPILSNVYMPSNKKPMRQNQHGSFTQLSPQDLEVGTQTVEDGNFSSAESVDEEETKAINVNQDRTGEEESYSLFTSKLRNRHHHQHPRAVTNHVKARLRSHPSPARRLLNMASPRFGNAASKEKPSISQSFLQIQQDLLKSIQHLLHKQEELEFQNLLVAEWRLVAQVVDRILFWIFFLITLASSGIFLVILPLYKRSWHGPK